MTAYVFQPTNAQFGVTNKKKGSFEELTLAPIGSQS